MSCCRRRAARCRLAQAWSRHTPAARQIDFGTPGVPPPVHTAVAVRPAGQPLRAGATHARRWLPTIPRIEQRIERKGGIAHPTKSIVPVPVHRRSVPAVRLPRPATIPPRAGLSPRFERDEGPRDGVAPRSVIDASLHPLTPPCFRVARYRLHVDKEWGRLVLKWPT